MNTTNDTQQPLAEQLNEFMAEIGVDFEDHSLLQEALTHRSYLNESSDKNLYHNERLEFLGDAVLELVTTEFLYERYPERPEGELTSFRAALVRTESLALEAKQLNYGKYILMSRGEEATGGRDRQYILANTFESVLGAMYLDKGLDTCRIFLQRILLPKTQEIVEKRLDIDPKSKLQEIAQEQLKHTPSYELITEEGPDHDKVFTMAVVVDNFQFGQGKGKSKQEAEQNAANFALDNWQIQVKKYSTTQLSTGV